MAQRVVIPNTVYNKATEIAEQREMSIKEAVRHMAQEGGYDV